MLKYLKDILIVGSAAIVAILGHSYLVKSNRLAKVETYSKGVEDNRNFNSTARHATLQREPAPDLD